MYRDAKEVLEARRRAASERRERQRSALSAEERARLPREMRAEIAAAETRCVPADTTSDAIVAAEEALDVHARLVERARALLNDRARDERRERHGRALEKIRRRALARPVLRGAVVAVAVLSAVWAVLWLRLDSECRESEGCKIRGDCGATRRLSCRPEDDHDCSRSEVCRELGWCSHAGERCIARTDEDCEESDECQRRGRCNASGGECLR